MGDYYYGTGTDILNEGDGAGAAGDAGGHVSFYVVREEDGTSKIMLEEGGGFILTEESV